MAGGSCAVAVDAFMTGHIIEPVARLSRLLNFPIDQLAAALCLLLSFPFAFILHWYLTTGSRRKSPIVTLCLATVPTHLLFFLSLCDFRLNPSGATDSLHKRCSQYIWDLLSVHVPVLGMWFGLRHSARLRSQPTFLFVLLLGIISYHHLSRELLFYNQYVVQVTGPLMVLTIKLSSFAYDVYDGKVRMESVSFAQFYGWCMLFGGFFTGPVPTFPDYCRFIEAPEKFFADRDEIADLRALRGRKRRASFLILTSGIMIYIMVLLKQFYPHGQLLAVMEDPGRSFLNKAFYLHLCLGEWRLKYYVAWMLAEAALVITGLGYRQRSASHPHKIIWDRLQNVNPLVIETTCDFRTIVAEWNVTTNRWLNVYIYQRLGRTFQANLWTYLVSALWHGFYPGYYVTFVSGALYTALCRSIYKRFSWPLPRRLRSLALYVPNYLIVDYFMASFSLQTWTDSWRFMRAARFYGHVALIFGFVVVQAMASLRRVRRTSDKKHR
jgi:lysophospholipid acyltransferase